MYRRVRGPARFAPLVAFSLWVTSAPPGAWAAEPPPPSPSQQPAPAPTPEQAALAQALFEQALELARQQQFGQACPKFAESLRLEAKSGSAYNLARCYEMTHRSASAWATYQEAARLARREGDDERAEKARQAYEALEPKLSTLTVAVAEPHRVPGLEVRRGDVIIPPSGWGVAVPVDAGEYVIEASAPGYVSFKASVIITGEPTGQWVDVPWLERLPPRPPPPPPPPAAPATTGPPISAPPLPPPARAPEEPPSAVGPVLVWSGFGVGAAGLAVGAITGAISWSRASQLQEACTDGWCDPALRSDYDTTITLANVSNVGFIVGAVGVGVGLVSLLALDVGEDEQAGGCSLRVAAGTGGGQLLLRY